MLLAAAVEMIHTATLVHDDVLDEATIRRHLATVNVRWNNETSVLLGDYLFTRALCMASSLDDVFACRELNNAARIMCEGELRQVESRGDYSLTEEQYYDIIRGKTAALTASCCRLGAHFAAADADIEDALCQYGMHLGVSFQIVDDLLDVLGDEAKVGKSLGTDLVKQKATLPVIRLLGTIAAGRPREADRPAPGVRRTPAGNSAALLGLHRRDLLRPRKGGRLQPACSAAVGHPAAVRGPRFAAGPGGVRRQPAALGRLTCLSKTLQVKIDRRVGPVFDDEPRRACGQGELASHLEALRFAHEQDVPLSQGPLVAPLQGLVGLVRYHCHREPSLRRHVKLDRAGTG